MSPAGFVTPQFTIRIPARTSSKSRSPQFVSNATASVKITLTANSAGATGINPVTTDISPTCGAGGCTATVNGPPSPPGTDSFTVQTFDATGAGGHTLNAGQLNNVTITAGQNNPESIVLGAVPATLTISNVPSGAGSLPAGTTGQTTAISVIAKDGHGDTIPTSQSPAVVYVNASGAALNVTVTDPDTKLHASCVIDTGTSTCTSAAATSVTFPGPDQTRLLAYDGLAENPVTLTATASGATDGTATFEPVLQTPVFNSSKATPTGVALSSSPEIDLFAPSGGGTGSTGSESFTESGWTNSTYNNALTVYYAGGTCTAGAGLASAITQIADVTAGSNSTLNGTPITAAAVASPTVGTCTTAITDGLASNSTEKSILLTVTYTTSSFTGSSKHRQ
ncbi:MAG TPA: hypothetical protein VGC96_11455 [Candidatus Elarobacter sp.]